MRKSLRVILLLLGICLPFSRSFSQVEWGRYGLVHILSGTPYCCIYLGLTGDNERAVLDTIAQFTKTNAMRECEELPGAYTGPPPAAYSGDHTAIFFRSNPTTFVIRKHNQGHNFGRSWDFYHWPINGSVQTNGVDTIQMPFTAIISVSPFGTNYSLQEFKQVSDGLASVLRLAFTNRSVYMFTSNTNRP